MRLDGTRNADLAVNLSPVSTHQLNGVSYGKLPQSRSDHNKRALSHDRRVVGRLQLAEQLCLCPRVCHLPGKVVGTTLMDGVK